LIISLGLACRVRAGVTARTIRNNGAVGLTSFCFGEGEEIK